MMLSAMSRHKGFTLLEVLVALSVLAISAMAVINQTGQSLQSIQQLESNTVALVVAENHITSLYIAENWPATGRSTDYLTYADQQWVINTQVSSTNDPWLRKIDVTVSQNLDQIEIPLVNLVTYRGRY